MNIWALRAASPNNDDYIETVTFLSDSLKNGISRFGWGYMEEADLGLLSKKTVLEMTEEENSYWRHTRFLLKINVGDWIVHVNLPRIGTCTAAKVIGKYEFEKHDNELSDYRHILKIDVATLIEFDRNDTRVLPSIKDLMRIRGSHWKITKEADFLQTIKNLKPVDDKKKKNSWGLTDVKVLWRRLLLNLRKKK